MPTLIITRGFPGSGKSTWADAQIKQSKGRIIGVNRDLLRMMTARQWWPADEELISAMQHEAIFSAIHSGKSVILDDTFLNERHVDAMRGVAEGLAVPFEVKSFLDVPLHVCIKRDAARERSVGKDVIVKMYYDYWKQQSIPINHGMRNAIICDIDGTLAHHTIPYPAAYARDYRDDEVDAVVSDILGVQWGNADVLLVTGRGQRMEQTEEWLATHRIHYDRLFCRPADDPKTDDAAVKKALYMQEIHGKWRVRFVIDDRPRVVRMWRAELGLKVFDVGDGREF